VRRGEEDEIVVAGADVVTGHDPGSGKELWRGDGLNPHQQGNFRIVASPVVFGEMVYVSGREQPLLAFRAFGRGNVANTHRVWTSAVGTDVPTPVTDGKYFYLVRDNGVLICFDALTGARVYGPARLQPGTYSSSPVLADGKLYATNEDGVTSVVKSGPQFSLLAENSLDDYVLSSPAIADGQIFIRTTAYLWSIGPRTAPAAR
jgi:outer membrane protein assembly factor BamB